MKINLSTMKAQLTILVVWIFVFNSTSVCGQSWRLDYLKEQVNNDDIIQPRFLGMEFNEVTAMLEYSGESYDAKELDDSHYQITRINERSIAEVLIFEIYGLSNKCVSEIHLHSCGGKKSLDLVQKRIKASDIKKTSYITGEKPGKFAFDSGMNIYKSIDPKKEEFYFAFQKRESECKNGETSSIYIYYASTLDAFIIE
ncbi:hypothetical protein [Cloacibacterium normanense]|uniref:hypothetical protein n=1 Tax=Cloacibacterium normanense TaxID=237258 RepID=UPI001056F2B8|nr:hypothetical protein [Cloacibacterium normanense]